MIIKHVYPRFYCQPVTIVHHQKKDVHRNSRIGTTKCIAPENLAIVIEARHYISKVRRKYEV